LNYFAEEASTFNWFFVEKGKSRGGSPPEDGKESSPCCPEKEKKKEKVRGAQPFATRGVEADRQSPEHLSLRRKRISAGRFC